MENQNMTSDEKAEQSPSQAKVFENGPVRVMGPCDILMPDGTTVHKPNGISFCRCGASANMPFCDASHKHTPFEKK